MSGRVVDDRLRAVTLLSHNDYLATMGRTREPLLPDEAAPVDVGRYIDRIDQRDFQGFDFSSRVVASAWSIDNGAWQHVLLNADVPNVFLVIVLDGRTKNVHGHYVLNLNRLYGTDD